MANWKKLASGAAGAAGGAALNVEDVFSTLVFTGDGSNSRSYTTGIDTSTEGGAIFMRPRNTSDNWQVYDTERGVSDVLITNGTGAALNFSGYGLTSFNTDGYSTGLNMSGENTNGKKIASWTFRKAPKFFDVVTYTGDGSFPRTINHNLGSVPGCIIIKCTTDARDWIVYHRGLDSTNPAGFHCVLNSTAAAVDSIGLFRDIEPTSTQFTVGGSVHVNKLDQEYVAYLFAHNNSDGGFGEDGTKDIIKCGSFSGGYETKVDLGFRPQWCMIKRTDSTGSWHVFDKMRGWHANPTYQSKRVVMNQTTAETSQLLFWPTADGFQFDDISTEVNYPTANYVYIAISDETRLPDDATDCFDINLFSGTGSNNELQAGTGWNADMVWVKPRSLSGYGKAYWARHHGGDLDRGNYLEFNSSAGFTQNINSAFSFTEKNGHYTHGGDTYGFHNYSGNYIDYVFKNTEGFFDSGVYLGPATASGSIAHRLGVKPELIYIKNNESSYDEVLGLQFGSSSYKESAYPMDYTYSSTSYSTTTNFGAEPDADNFYVNDNNKTGASSQRYSYQAFATLAGISKLGTYTGTGSTQTINCAFSNGARFVMIKDLGGNSQWYMFTSDQGISSSSNDPYLQWGSADSEVTNTNFLNAASSGFALNGSNILNTNGSTYFFVAIA